jgi:phosphoserine phosphatase RsbU/P
MMFSDGIAEILPEKDLPAKEALLLSMVEEGNASIDMFITRLGLQEAKNLPDDVTILTLWRKPAS